MNSEMIIYKLDVDPNKELFLEDLAYHVTKIIRSTAKKMKNPMSTYEGFIELNEFTLYFKGKLRKDSIIIKLSFKQDEEE